MTRESILDLCNELCTELDQQSCDGSCNHMKKLTDLFKESE